MNKLPNKPSALIRNALFDLSVVEGKEEYEVNMIQWHVPTVSGGCSVCLAGAVLANTLKISPETFFGWEDIGEMPEHNRVRLVALDDFRAGMVCRGLGRMGIDHEYAAYADVTPYSESPKLFKKDMTEMANNLESAGF